MASKVYEFPCLVLRLGKSKTEVKVKVSGSDLARVEFDAYKVRGKAYAGRVDLRLCEGRFTASAYDHRHSIYPADQLMNYKAVTDAARKTICSDAEALIAELRTAKPEVFLDADIVSARMILASQESTRNDIQAKLVEADEKCAACVRAVKAAIEKRKAFRKK